MFSFWIGKMPKNEEETQVADSTQPENNETGEIVDGVADQDAVAKKSKKKNKKPSSE